MDTKIDWKNTEYSVQRKKGCVFVCNLFPITTSKCLQSILRRGPGWFYLVWMILGIVCAQSIPRPTDLLTNNTWVDETKVDICVLLATLLRFKHFSTTRWRWSKWAMLDHLITTLAKVHQMWLERITVNVARQLLLRRYFMAKKY